MNKKIHLLARCVAILSLATSGYAFAQMSTGGGIPDALKELKQAGGVCLRDSYTPSDFRAASGRAPADLSCAIVPKDITKILDQPNTVLVDVRNAADFLAFRINGAMNASASSLRTKKFLRDKTIVLIGSGKAEAELYTACSDLRSDGFKRTLVLRGGMASWITSEQPMLMQSAPDNQPEFLNASEFITESQFRANLIVVERSQELLQRQLPSSILIPDESVAALKSAIEKRRKESKNAPLAAVVLVRAPNSGGEEIQKLRHEIQPVPLLIYAGGVDNYTQQLKQQKAIWAAQARGPKQPGCGL